MTLTELRYLIALAQEGSFSRAAEVCAVSQPTLSQSIARLESEMGIPLFERGIGFVSPSEAGMRIVAQARVVMDEVAKVKQLAQSGQDPLSGTLRIGLIHTVAPYLLPRLIQHLTVSAPDMPLAIEENMTANLANMLRDNLIDVAILALPFEAPGVLTRHLYDEPFKVIVPRKHAWHTRTSIDAADIDGQELLLLKGGNCFRDQVLEACPKVSAPDSDAQLGHSLETIRSMVASGLGISVLPESATLPPHANDMIHVLPFSDPVPYRRIGLAWRVGFVRPKVIDVLAQAAQPEA